MNGPAMTPFPCNGCGKCCRLVDRSHETAWLDRGDGTCRNFDENARSCMIYEQRPLVCRVQDYYVAHLATRIKWDDFVKLNVDICSHL